MKHSNNMRFLLLGLSLFLPLLAVAQYRHGSMAYSRGNRGSSDNYHFIYVSAGGGYSGLGEDVDVMSTTGGFGGLLGIGYEFRRTHFWMSVGGQLSLHNSKSKIDDFHYEHTGLDTQTDRKQVMLNYTFHEKQTQQLTFVDVPLMFGYYYNGFYAGAGGKVSFALSSKVNNSGTFDLEYVYPQYVAMPSPPLENNEFSGSQQVKMNVGGSLIGEVGYDVLASKRTRGSLCNLLKVGFYFEYGLNNFIAGDANLERISFPNRNANGETIATEPKVNPYLSLKQTDARIVPYFVGVKITYMFGGSRTGATGTWHRGCQCYE